MTLKEFIAAVLKYFLSYGESCSIADLAIELCVSESTLYRVTRNRRKIPGLATIRYQKSVSYEPTLELMAAEIIRLKAALEK